jgi:protein-tyrosine phosphatase
MKTSFHVTFVCMGNICRSPTAHGVFRQKVQNAGLALSVGVDSAGTHDFHPGAAPDRRSQTHARARGYDLADLRARQLTAPDFERADLLLVMDDDNLDETEGRCPPAHRHKLRKLTEFCRVQRSPVVPDPYYGGPADFEQVLDLVEDACEGLLEHVRRELGHRATK